MEDEALTLLARQCTGSLRDAISLLDQLASTGQEITLDLAQSVLGTVSQLVLDLVDAVLSEQAASGLDHIHRTLDAGSDPRQFARQVVDYLRNLLLVRMGSADQVDATAEVRAQMARHAQSFSVPELLRVIRVFNQAANDARSAWRPSLPLELAFAESLEQTPLEVSAMTRSAPGPLDFCPARPWSGCIASKSSPAPRDFSGATHEEVVEQGGEPAEVPEEGGLTVKMVSEHWRQILALVRQRNPTTQGLLNSGKLLGVKDGTLYLGYSEVLKFKMEKSENIEIVCQVLKQVLGMDVPVRCVVIKGRGPSLPPDVDSDGMVAAALQTLAARLWIFNDDDGRQTMDDGKCYFNRPSSIVRRPTKEESWPKVSKPQKDRAAARRAA